MTPLDLSPIRERLGKATPGPWYHRQAGEHRPSDSRQKYDWIGDSPHQGQHKRVIVGRDAVFGGEPDYAFIARAPTDISALLEEVERLRAGLRQVAAYDDELANEWLKKSGSYSSFDEPCAVECARALLPQEQK